MSSTTTEVHRFHSLFAAQEFLATLQAAKKSYHAVRIPRPKAGKQLYMGFVYG